jgi:hypothetical protein
MSKCSLPCGEDVDLEVSEWRNIFCMAGAGAPSYAPVVDPLVVPAVTSGWIVGGAVSCTDPLICPMPIPIKGTGSSKVPKAVGTGVPSPGKGDELPKTSAPGKAPSVPAPKPKGQRPKGPVVDFEG